MPLFLITGLSLILVLINAFDKKGTVAYYFSTLTLLAGLAAAIGARGALGCVKEFPAYISEMLQFSPGLAVFDIIFLAGGIFVLLLSKDYFKRMYESFGEIYTLILFSIVGMLLIAHADNMIILFLGIEIMSISFYILSAIIRTNVFSVEAGLKYFLLGAFASGFLLMGISFVYGSTGTMSLSGVLNPEVFHGSYFYIGMILLLVGLLFKAAVIPFHQWAPDVYTGAPTPITAFMTTAGKAGAIAGFIAISGYILNIVSMQEVILEHIGTIQNILAVLAAVTMIVGNMIALVQKNLKRMLAYSSIAHAGYILTGIAAMNQSGIEAAIFYSFVYLFMQFLAFIVLAMLESKENQVIEIDDISGLRKKAPFLAAMMAAAMFALVGIPPFGGFIGKFMLFKAVIDAGMLWLAITAVIGSLISVYFYINIIIKMYFKEESPNLPDVEQRSAYVPMILTAVAILLFGILPGIIM